IPATASPVRCLRTRQRRRERGRGPRSISVSCLLLSGRDRFDDAEGIETGALRGLRGVASRWGVEDVEADLVLGNVDRVVEADARRPARQLLRYRACSSLTGGALPGLATSQVGLDEVTRHASTLRSRCYVGNVRTSELCAPARCASARPAWRRRASD